MAPAVAAVPAGELKGVPYLSNASMSRSSWLPASAVIFKLSGIGRSTSDSAHWANT